MLCYVQDNGIGIGPGYRERVFNLFERLEARSQGTGVDLAIFKRIVEFFGGSIWIESGGSGRGARFEFILPAATD